MEEKDEIKPSECSLNTIVEAADGVYFEKIKVSRSRPLYYRVCFHCIDE
jgi:hypothetical protein